MKFEEFDSTLGRNSYVRCLGKERLDPEIVDFETAQHHIFQGGTAGWWVTEGYIVIDIDEHADLALKMLAELDIKTLSCLTPRGVHLYFKTDIEMPQKIKIMLPIGIKCDVRVARKGYVMLPYGMNDRKFSRTTTVAALPNILVPMLGVTRETLVGMKDGDGRNDTLFRHLMDYKNRGGTDEEIADLANRINNILFATPMEQKELNKLIKSVGKYEAQAKDNQNPYILYSKAGFPTQINNRAVCDYFVNRGDVFVLGGEAYQYRNGRYIESSSNVRNTIREMLGAADSLITQERIMSTYRFICDDVRIQRTDSQLNSDRNLVNFDNGMYNISEKRLQPHDSKHLSTVQIPQTYVAASTPLENTRFMDFIRLTQLPQSDVDILLDYMAYCLTLENGLKTFLMLAGQSNTGKSLLIRFIENMIGHKNVSALSMHELNQRFYPSLLKDKLVNSCADNSSLPLNSIENLKKITGGDQLMHEKKGKEPYFFTPFAKLIFSFNQLPLQLEEKSNAFYNRMRIVYMNVPLFLNQAYVDEFLDSVQELIPHLLDRLPLADISNSETSQKLVASLRSDSDSIHAFLESEMVMDPDAYIAKNELYDLYQKYCIDNGRESHRKHAFMRHIRSVGVEDARHPKERYSAWKGLRRA